MGEVVRLRRPDPERDAYEAEVRDICRLAGCPDWASDFIAARRPVREVLADCTAVALGRRLPQDIARRWARLIGPVGPRRRALPRWLGHYIGDRP